MYNFGRIGVMNKEAVRVVTWNIAGGRRAKSLKRWDYEAEDLRYFIDQLKRLSPDIICLQETHSKPDRSVTQVQVISDGLEMEHVYECVMSNSHIDINQRLGIAIISRLKLNEVKTYKYEHPWFKLLYPDGRKAKKHDKYLLKAKVGDFYVVNTQLLPLHIWGYSYDEGEGYQLAQKHQELFLGLKRPLIMCGDINTNYPEKVYNKFFEAFSLAKALPDVPTRPERGGRSRRSDYILYSSEFKLVSSGVVKTQTDHYLCMAELGLC
jgi:endonuclease/exonuclease/phosphatase family metal-dependent hydrolase